MRLLHFLLALLLGTKLCSAALPFAVTQTNVGRDGLPYLLIETGNRWERGLWVARLDAGGRLDRRYGRGGVVPLLLPVPVDSLSYRFFDIDGLGRMTMLAQERGGKRFHGWLRSPDGSDRNADDAFVFDANKVISRRYPDATFADLHLYEGSLFALFNVPNGLPGEDPHHALIVRWNADGTSPALHGEETELWIYPDQVLGTLPSDAWWAKQLGINADGRLSVLFERGFQQLDFASLSVPLDLAMRGRIPTSGGQVRVASGPRLLSRSTIEHAWDSGTDELIVVGRDYRTERPTLARSYIVESNGDWYPTATLDRRALRGLRSPPRKGMFHAFTEAHGLVATRLVGKERFSMYQVRWDGAGYTPVLEADFGPGGCGLLIAAAINAWE